MSHVTHPDRRTVLLAAGTAIGSGVAYFCTPAFAQMPPTGLVVSVTEFGARSGSPQDSTRAIQAAIHHVEGRGGGTILIPGRFRCGNLVISGSGVRLQGQGGWLIDGRLTIAASAEGIEVVDLGVLHTRGDPASYLLDVSGRNCRFQNLQLVKHPVAGGYQGYIRQPASHCHFTGLRLKGSNGLMVAGRDHLFERFELESTMTAGVGGDDAFAIKALGSPSYNITIRNGLIRGFYAVASFGSEIGTAGRNSSHEAFVRNVSVSDVIADRCSSLAFFKPGALIYDWRNGLIEGVRLERLRLNDERGERFTSGVRMIAARGAVIRNVVGRDLSIRARAMNQGVQPTSAIDLSLLDGADATIENIDLQMTFVDPYQGARHSAAAPGYAVDHIVRIEKTNPGRGSMGRISIDITGTGSRFGGAFIGRGLDDAVTLRRAHLKRVGLNPPASVGGGGIWSESRVRLGDLSIDSPVLPRFGGPGLANRR